MTVKFPTGLLLYFSVWFFFVSLTFDSEFVYFTSPLIIWHFWSGFSHIMTDYVYSKAVKLILLFFLQISVILILDSTITFLF